MVDFVFMDNSGTMVVLHTDAADINHDRFTIANINGLNTVAKQIQYNLLKVGQVVDKVTLVNLANANSHNLLCIVNKPQVITTPTYQVQQTLGAPGSFTATPAAGHFMNLAWNAVTNATSYAIDRATNVGFTTGVTLNIYTKSGTSFQDSGLTASTTYFYRLRAVGLHYLNSANSTASATAI